MLRGAAALLSGMGNASQAWAAGSQSLTVDTALASASLEPSRSEGECLMRGCAVVDGENMGVVVLQRCSGPDKLV